MRYMYLYRVHARTPTGRQETGNLMYATRNDSISVRQITSCIHSEPNHAYYPVFYEPFRTSTIRNRQTRVHTG